MRSVVGVQNITYGLRPLSVDNRINVVSSVIGLLQIIIGKNASIVHPKDHIEQEICQIKLKIVENSRTSFYLTLS